MAALVFLCSFVVAIRDRHEFPLFQGEWNGLGGGLGGLRMSKAFSFAILTIFFGGLAAVIVFQQVQADRERARNDFELLKIKESEMRKYDDAKQARQFELEKLRLASPAPAKAAESKPVKQK